MWFDDEFVHLVRVAEEGGDLADALARLAERHDRIARRLIDRLAGLLEPAAIVLLAAFVGVVVMAAVLPLMRLQEVVA